MINLVKLEDIRQIRVLMTKLMRRKMKMKIIMTLMIVLICLEVIMKKYHLEMILEDLNISSCFDLYFNFESFLNSRS